MHCIKLSIITILFLISSTHAQKTITGRVVGITDGDTFKLLVHDTIQYNVRLANIDCPEKAQPFSTKAKQFLSDAIFGKEVSIKILRKDRYKRLIATVFCNDKNINHELLKSGLAWHYTQYSKDKTLQELEDTAKRNKIGLWSEPNPIAPWEWRENRKRKSKS